MIYLVGGLALNILSIVLYQFESTRDINRNVLRYLFRLLPNFAVCDTIFYLSLRTFLRQSQWDLNISGFVSTFFFTLSLLLCDF
jgi:hypothetical protein